ncbi:butyrophilin subfamily 3 member A3-like [Calonectris borealis]|uniref:butyrophilin subfamily 3 member A3-like n=1 Tax=Calonectris borealis TaxID=1323832 RepID=UPI003F4C5B00
MSFHIPIPFLSNSPEHFSKVRQRHKKREVKARRQLQEKIGMGPSVQLTAVIFVLVSVSTPHPTAGGGHDPLLVLDGYEDDGIRLKCFSKRLFSEVQVLWTDGRGDNVTGTPLTTGTATASTSSSIILKPGSGNFVSCKIIDKLLKTSTESSVVIADVFFPATSPWLAAFVVILLLSIFLVIAAIYKLRKNSKTTIRENVERHGKKLLG